MKTGAVIHAAQTIVSDGLHNAFPSLARWRGQYYCAYRQAQGHGEAFPGCIVIMHSQDGKSWTACARLSTPGDDRDPKLFVRNEQLACLFGTYYPRWGAGHFLQDTLPNRRMDVITHMTLSDDGVHWTLPMQCYRPNYWLWSVAPDEDGRGLHSAAYHFGESTDVNSLHLLWHDCGAEDWSAWQTIGAFALGHGLAEPALCWHDGTLYCFARVGDRQSAQVFIATPPDTWEAWAWEQVRLTPVIHAPCAVSTPQGILVAGRGFVPANEEKPREARMRLWMFDPRTHWMTTVTDLPSAGDCGYAGMLWDQERGAALLVYYSQHEYAGEAYDAEVATLSRRLPPYPANLYAAWVEGL